MDRLWAHHNFPLPARASVEREDCGVNYIRARYDCGARFLGTVELMRTA